MSIRKKIWMTLAVAAIFGLAAAAVVIKPVGFKNGHVIRMNYFCSDYCPETKGSPAYMGVETQAECESIGGAPVLNWAWGKEYVYCGVK